MPTDRAAGQPSRRALLRGTGAALAVLVTGCTGEPAPSPAPSVGAGSAASSDADRPALTTARATEAALLARTPGSLAEARRVLTAHVAALDAVLATAAPTPTTETSAPAVPTPTTGATTRSLALALQAAAGAHRFALVGVSGPAAALLASLAASDAVLARALLADRPAR